jgi:hypothetical protein
MLLATAFEELASSIYLKCSELLEILSIGILDICVTGGKYADGRFDKKMHLEGPNG